MKQYRTYIFDLDGTLLDTLEDLYLSTNHALRQVQLPERSLEEIRQFVGNGVRRLIERAVPDGADNPRFGEVFRLFKQHYLEHGEDHTAPYPGVLELLAALKREGRQTAVVSNKFLPATQELCGRFFPGVVDIAVGEHEGVRCKPAPDMVEKVLLELHADKSSAVYIGDSDVDLQTARNSGLPCVSVLWGFRDRTTLLANGATTFISNPMQLLQGCQTGE